jgi:hypothetical protein
MFIAKVIALVGLVLCIAGAIGALVAASLALGSVLLLVAATAGAVALESRDVQGVAGLAPQAHDLADDSADEAAADVIQLVRPGVRRAA